MFTKVIAPEPKIFGLEERCAHLRACAVLNNVLNDVQLGH